LYQWKLMNVY